MDWTQIQSVLLPILEALGVVIAGYILKKAPEFTEKQFNHLESKSQNEYWKRFLSACETIVLGIEQSMIKEFKKANADREVSKAEWTAIYSAARNTAQEEIIKAIESILPESLKPIAREMLPSLIEASVAKVKLSRDGLTINPS